MSSAIILGDVHLGKSLSIGRVAIGSALNSRVVDQNNLLDWVLEQTVARGIEDIIITGDIFEEPKPHPSLIALFAAWLKQCAAYEVHVHIILGNHDILRTGNYYTSPLDIISACELENVSIYRDIKTIFIDNVAFTFMPFRDRKSFNVESNLEALNLLKNNLIYELASIPLHYRKLLVGHFAIEGSIPIGDEIDDLTNELFCPLEMFKGYDYVWMGHVHKPQIMSQNPYIAHIGSMDISNFGETDHKKHIIVYDLELEKEFEKITLPTRTLQKIVISVPAETKDTTKFVIEEIGREYPNLAKAIVKLEIYLTAPELLSIDRAEVEKFVYQQNIFNVAGISESKKLAPILKKTAESTTINTNMDIPSAIKLWANQIEENKRDKFIETSLNILQEFKNQSKD